MYHVIDLKQTRGIKNITLKEAKNSWVSRSTGKSNIQHTTQSTDLHVKSYGARTIKGGINLYFEIQKHKLDQILLQEKLEFL